MSGLWLHSHFAVLLFRDFLPAMPKNVTSVWKGKPKSELNFNPYQAALHLLVFLKGQVGRIEFAVHIKHCSSVHGVTQVPEWRTLYFVSLPSDFTLSPFLPCRRQTAHLTTTAANQLIFAQTSQITPDTNCSPVSSRCICKQSYTALTQWEGGDDAGYGNTITQILLEGKQSRPDIFPL